MGFKVNFLKVYVISDEQIELAKLKAQERQKTLDLLKSELETVTKQVNLIST